jgi:hypothetical protein
LEANLRDALAIPQAGGALGDPIGTGGSEPR